MIKTTIHKLALAVGTLILTVFAVAAVPSGATAQNNTITACFHNTNGKVRLVQSASQCKNNESPATWNIVGPQGPAGADGADGAAGADGADGADGTNGADGQSCSVSECSLDGVARITCGASAVDISCIPPDLKVFVTSTAHTGDLGGLAGADDICNARAQDAGLPGTFVAWLSTSTVNAIDRLSLDGPWVTTTGDLVAQSKADLTDGSLASPINRDEFGAPPPFSGTVWTGTFFDGSKSLLNCMDWTSSAGGREGVFGSLGSALVATAQWSRGGGGEGDENPRGENRCSGDFGGSSGYAIFCFEN